MNEISENSSGSDISSRSWTFLDDNLTDDEQLQEESEKQKVETEKETENLQAEPKHSTSFLTFDEYMQERLLEYDYEHQEKPQKIHKLYREKLRNGLKNHKAQKWGISVFILIILGLSSFATLVSTLSQHPIERKAPGKYQPVKRGNIPIYKKIADNLNNTLKEFDDMKVDDFFDVPKNATESKQCQKATFKSLLDELSPKRPNNQTFIGPTKPKKAPKVQLEISEVMKKILNGDPLKESAAKAKWVKIKDFLLDTNIHALVSLVITNFYLFTLLMDFNKQNEENSPTKPVFKEAFLEDLDKCKNVEEIRRYLFKELPFWNAELTPKEKRKRKAKKAKPISKTTSMMVLKPKVGKSQTPIWPSNFSAPIIPKVFEETGKSECQKRFEELDEYQRKYEVLKQAQKNKIKLLKQKFKNEVNFIRDTEEESDVKAERINRTSQMFIKKLKFNREKYLLELKKVRDQRRKLSEPKKKEVAVGSYEVALPAVYNYGYKFQMLKEKFEKEKPQTPKVIKFQ